MKWTVVVILALIVLDASAQSGQIKLGYREDARPFSYRDEAGKPAGYSVGLCTKIAEQLRATPEWVQVGLNDRFSLLREGKVDLLCGADTVTLARRKEVSFSIPVYPGGIGALVRKDAPPALLKALAQRGDRAGPPWRGTPTQNLVQAQTFVVVAGTSSEKALADRIAQFVLNLKVAPVSNYAAGVQALSQRKATVFVGDYAILAAAQIRNPNLVLVEGRLAEEVIALALRRGDEDFRLAVDTALTRIYGSADFQAIYGEAFGVPDERASEFFRSVALPD